MVKTVGVEFFCYHRDRPGSVTLRQELLEQHWSYMDRYQAEMIARGPTLAGDGDTPTGSVHIADLPDPAAARAFAFDEPGYQAGIYRDVLLRRWRNLLGRTMWDFPGGQAGGNRYLVLGLGTGPAEGIEACGQRQAGDDGPAGWLRAGRHERDEGASGRPHPSPRVPVSSFVRRLRPRCAAGAFRSVRRPAHDAHTSLPGRS